MEEISKQLRAEVDALQEYIARIEDRFLATTWTADLLDPLTRLERHLGPEELRSIVALLQRVRDQFSVNGNLTPQIAALLARYPEYLTTAGEPLAAALPAQDPALDPAPLGSPAEDEEQAEAGAPAATQTLPPQPAKPAASPVVKPKAAPREDEESEDLSGLSMDLFSSPRRPPPLAPANKEPSPSTLNLYPLGEKKRAAAAAGVNISPRQDLFLAHKIRPADLKTHMQLTLPPQDQVQLDFKLQKKMSSRLADSLREHAERHSLLLVPRVTQFIYQGTLCPCTVRTLTRLFRPLLGNLRDLAPYQACGFMDETPEPGWALITPEALPDTLGLNYLAQQQSLRQRATELGVISRMVRRRSLVEAVYDLIAAQLVLGLKLNQKTLDATSSGPTASDFVCTYFSAEGIRFKDLPRTDSHPAIGVCPSL